MLQIDGVVPRLGNEECEELICQQYLCHGKLAQAVDGLFIRVRGRWHRLYFDEGIVFWRCDEAAPVAREVQPGDPFVYPLIDVGETYALKGCLITDCVIEPLVGGARVVIGFENRGSLMVTQTDNQTALRFIESMWPL